MIGPRPLPLAVIAAVALGLSLVFNRMQAEPLPLLRPDERVLLLREGILPIGLDSVRGLLGDPAWIFVDARPALSWRMGHIPGSINLPEFSFDSAFSALPEAPAPETPVVVYCESVECTASDLVARRLKDRGMRYIRLFEGGWHEWRAAGLPVEKGGAR